MTLLERVRSQLIAYCRHLLWDPNDLDDALQTTLATAFDKFNQFEAGTDFRSWVFRITTNIVFNINRKSARDSNRFVPLDLETVDIVTELQREYAYDELLRDPDRVLAQVGDEMHEALLSLTPPERSVFLMKTIGDLTCREIAATLTMPMGSVMGYLARARGKLRTQLCEYARKYGFLSNETRKETLNGL